MELSDSQKKHLRGLGHRLKPVVMIGQHGLTDGVVAETERALADHELIKVRARLGGRESRDATLEDLAARTGATIVQRVGNVGLLYKENSILQKILIPDS